MTCQKQKIRSEARSTKHEVEDNNDTMDSIVQLIRNALCCIKDLNIFGDSVLYDSTVTNTILKSFLPEMELKEPFNRTTPLELIISVTQLYACLSCTYGGSKLCWTSVGKLKRIVSLLEHRLIGSNSASASASASSEGSSASSSNTSNKNSTTASKLINESLIKEAKLAMKNIFIGLCVTPIGIAFFWLFGNSLHVTEAGTIGGLTALIDALTVMEICMLPLLYYMIIDAIQYFTTCKETQNCITILSSNAAASFNHSYVNITRYELIQSGWVPYWESGTSPMVSSSTSTSTSTGKDDELFDMEMKLVEQTLSLYFPTTTSSSNKDDKNEKEQKIRQEAIDSSINEMNKSLSVLTFKGYREYLYFVLNFAAFYGYLMAVICFYYPDDTAQPSWMEIMKFNTTNNIADWTGNFVGDLMWTIEPIIILFLSPYYISSLLLLTTTTSVTKKKSSLTTTTTNKTKKE